MISLDDLLLFSTIVESGSLTVAAKKLGLPKSKLSRRLTKLEEQMQCQLIVRTTRRQELTESGKILYHSSKPHLDALEDIEDDVNAMNNEPKGHLHILLPIEFFNRVMGILVTEFAKLYPKIIIHCSHYSSAHPIEDPRYDLIFVLHETSLPATNWVGKTLISFVQSLYAGNEYAISHLKHPNELQNERCIASDEKSQWLFRDKEQIQMISIKEKIILSSPEMRLEAIIQNLGIAKLPDYVCQTSGKLSQLQKITLSNQPLALQLTVLYQSRSIPFKTRVFLDYFQSKIGCLSW